MKVTDIQIHYHAKTTTQIFEYDTEIMSNQYRVCTLQTVFRRVILMNEFMQWHAHNDPKFSVILNF